MCMCSIIISLYSTCPLLFLIVKCDANNDDDNDGRYEIVHDDEDDDDDDGYYYHPHLTI